MAIREKEENKKNGMKVTDNMDGEKKANEKLQAKLFPPPIPKDLSYDDAVKTFEMSLDRKPKSIDELLDFFKNRKLNKKTPKISKTIV